MSAATLERALRAMADTPSMVAMTFDDIDSKSSRELHEASELVRVLARLLAGKTVHEAFGAPGDWGYETPIGQALYQLYSSNSFGANRLLHSSSAAQAATAAACSR